MLETSRSGYLSRYPGRSSTILRSRGAIAQIYHPKGLILQPGATPANLDPHHACASFIHKRQSPTRVPAMIQEGEECVGHRILEERAQIICRFSDWWPKGVFVRILRRHHIWGKIPPSWEEEPSKVLLYAASGTSQFRNWRLRGRS